MFFSDIIEAEKDTSKKSSKLRGNTMEIVFFSQVKGKDCESFYDKDSCG